MKYLSKKNAVLILAFVFLVTIWAILEFVLPVFTKQLILAGLAGWLIGGNSYEWAERILRDYKN